MSSYRHTEENDKFCLHSECREAISKSVEAMILAKTYIEQNAFGSNVSEVLKKLESSIHSSRGDSA